MNGVIEVLSNPVKLQIIQFLQNNGATTTKEIANNLKNIKIATLYRHIDALIKSNLIKIIAEKKVRGGVERTLDVNKSVLDEFTHDDLADMAYQFLMEVYGSAYEDDKDTEKNLDEVVLFRKYRLNLDEGEYRQMIEEMNDIISRYGQYELTEGRKARSLAVVTAPAR